MKKILSLTLAVILIFSLSIAALAKTASEPIDPPPALQEVFFVKIGSVTITYTWADISGDGSFETQTASYPVKIDGVNSMNDFTGVSLALLLQDAAAKADIGLSDNFYISTFSADDYLTIFPYSEVLDPSQRYIVCADAVSNSDGDISYDNSFVRFMRGEEDTTSNLSSIRCLLGVEILDADKLPLVTTSSGNSTSSENPDAPYPFTDLANYTWASDAIAYLYAKAIVTGTSTSSFSPADTLRRGDFILMLYRAFGFPDGSDNFSDVPPGSYYYDAISACKALGIARGNGETFNPNGEISRQDAMTLICRALTAAGYEFDSSLSVESALDSFADAASIADYALEPVSTLVAAGIINGADGNIQPLNNITRAEMSAALYKALKLYFA